MFNASAALAQNTTEKRVEIFDEQDRLDIKNKNRTSVLPWRGQFSPELIEYLIEQNCPSGGYVVDPFCGSGTVLYEAALLGMEAYAVDINPAAICLAEFSDICRIKTADRVGVIEEISDFMKDLCSLAERMPETSISAEYAAQHLKNKQYTPHSLSTMRAGLLLAFGNQSHTTPIKLLRASKALETTVTSAPYALRPIRCEIGDARHVKVEDNCVDYLVTSPPYINVFNYHQNYRPIAEALGYTPLSMARAEIGANRKHRQNRYMTVVQYCIDMALFFVEAQRILKSNGSMTIVLGRESNVRGVAFRNGEIIGTIASEGLNWILQSWRERKFLNRFGETIYEDVLTLSPPSNSQNDAQSIGRLVGIEALRVGLEIAPAERKQEISDAMEFAPSIQPSPYVLEEAIENT